MGKKPSFIRILKDVQCVPRLICWALKMILTNSCESRRSRGGLCRCPIRAMVSITRFEDGFLTNWKELPPSGYRIYRPLFFQIVINIFGFPFFSSSCLLNRPMHSANGFIDDSVPLSGLPDDVICGLSSGTLPVNPKRKSVAVLDIDIFPIQIDYSFRAKQLSLTARLHTFSLKFSLFYSRTSSTW